MAVSLVVLLSVFLGLSNASNDTIPPDFKFGTSTSAYQIEGAWNVSGKGLSIWDVYTHANESRIADGSNGDVACDSYHLYQRDIEMGTELGQNFYRFSISWPRLLPNGFTNLISEDSKKYYSDLIDALLGKGIEPVVTLYHWDLPQRFQNLGGWTNPLVSNWFAEYVKVVYTLYADRVKTWITFNEPSAICDLAYEIAIFAPGIEDPKIAPYLCNKNILISHAKAWRIYDKDFKPKYHGNVSIAEHMVWFQPYSEEDKNLTQLVAELFGGRYNHPIYSNQGGWPPAIEKVIRDNSIKEGYSCSRLPPFTEDEIQLVKGTYDFFGLNYYISRLVRRARPGEKVPYGFFTGVPELNAVLEVDPSWPMGIYPKGLRKQLADLKDKYGNLKFIITENGFSTTGNSKDFCDKDRISFIQKHLKQVLLSIYNDGVNVIGYAYWSLMDNFEWYQGHTAKFGLYEVDFTSPMRTRTPRASALYFRSIIESRSLDVPQNITSM